MKRKLDRKRVGMVYFIENILNGKKYVGSTIMKVRVRKNEHFYHLRHNTHHCSHLQRAWNKYGEDNFVYGVIEMIEVEYVEQILVREQKWIDFHSPLIYNTHKIAGSSLGFEMPQQAKDKIGNFHRGKPKSDSHRNKIREIRTGAKNSEESKRKNFENMKSRCIRISQCDMDGKFIQSFESLMQADKKGFSPNKIKKCCLGEYKSHKGFIWKFSDEESKSKSFSSSVHLENRRCREVAQYDLLGNLIRYWGSMTQADKEEGFNFASISSCCNGYKKTHKGFIWIFKNGNKEDESRLVDMAIKNLINGRRRKVCQYDSNGSLIKIWDSASHIDGYSQGNISGICNGGYGKRSYGGFVWKYYDEIKNLSKGELMKVLFPIKAKVQKPKARRMVVQLDCHGNIVKTWGSISQATQDGFRIPQIVDCCKGRRRSHGGFRWKYADTTPAPVAVVS